MKSFLKRLRIGASQAFWACYVFCMNLYIEAHNRRLRNKRRDWSALLIGGGGIVPLGYMTQQEAVSKCAEFGTIGYVDEEAAIVFYSVRQ